MTGTQRFGASLCFAFLAASETRSAAAHPAWGIVVDPSGRVFFSDLETVWRIDEHGKLSVARAGVSGRHVHELAIDDQGNVYGPDYEYISEAAGFRNALWRMDAEGRVTYVVPPRRTLPRGASIWRDPAGNTYSVEEDNHLKRETLLVKRAPSGEVTVLAGSRYGLADGAAGQAQFSDIVGLAICRHELFVTDGSAVRKVSLTGEVSTLARNLDTDRSPHQPLSFGGLMGLAVGPAGEVFVADFRNRRVLKITAGGAVSVVLRAEPPWSPTGVALGSNGDLHVLEFGFKPPGTWLKPRVRKLSSRGVTTTQAALE